MHMKMPSFQFTSLVLVWFAVVPHTAQAQDIASQAMISNLDQIWTQGGMGNFETVIPGHGYGFMFKTDATPYLLNTVTFEMLNGGNPATLDIQLYTLEGSFPSTNPNFVSAGQLGDPTIDSRPTQWPGSTSFVDFTPITPITLAPDTDYLIGVIEPANGDDNNALTFNFNYTYTFSGDWSSFIVPYWSYGPPLGPPPAPQGWKIDSSNGSLMLEVNATPAPEPGVSMLFLFGCALFGVAGWAAKPPEPTAVGAVSSAVAVPVTSRKG